MRDASVPTPAIVDSQLIEDPFEVSVLRASTLRYAPEDAGIDAPLSSRRADEDALDSPGSSRRDRARERAERRAQKAADKQAARRARTSENTDADIDPRSTDSAPGESRPPSSFDELIGYTQS